MATFTVTSTAAYGAGSLYQALLDAAANGTNTADTIIFDNTMANQTFDMGQTLFLAQDITIDGDIGNDGDADVTISGGGTGGHRLFTIGYGYTVTLDSLKLAYGYDKGSSAYYSGGNAASAVMNYGTLTITNSLVQNNVAIGGDGTSAYGYGYRGGDAATIFNFGNVTITNTVFSTNSALGGNGSDGGDGSHAGAVFPYYSPAGSGNNGGRGGHAASVLLQVGYGATLDGVSISAGTTWAGVGGAGGNGGMGDFGPYYGYSGGRGGDGGAGGSAGAIVIGYYGANGNVNFTAPQVNNAGLGGAYGAGGYRNGATYDGDNGTQGADGQKGSIVFLYGATGSVAQVTNNYDAGTGSLRDAILNSTAGDTIYFDASLKGQVIRLTSAELDILQDLTINGDVDGDGKADITISGDGDGVLGHSIDDVRIFDVTSNANLTLRSLTLTGGHADSSNGDNGGAILTAAGTTLTLINSTIGHSQAVKGAGIYAGGALTVVNSTIHDNVASSFGGGVYVNGVAASFVNVTITANTAFVGGGIDTFTGSQLLIINSTITGNYAGDKGGGIDLYALTSTPADFTQATIYNSIVSGNSAYVASTNDVSKLGTPGSTLLIGGYNLVGSTVDFDGGAANNVENDTPLLGTLFDNGGPVLTMRPLDGSPVIAAGRNSDVPLDIFDIDGDGDTSEQLPLDARGGQREVGVVDIGAVEFTGPVVTVGGDADTITNFTDDLTDGGGLTLREAVRWANAGETITFDDGVAGTITLIGGPLVLTQDVTIDGDTNGDNKADITISGNDLVQLIQVDSGTTTLLSLTLSHGYSSDVVNGGALGIASGAVALVRDTTFSDNRHVSTGASLGGAINSSGTLSIVNSTFSGNAAIGSTVAGYGGALYAGSGSTTSIVNSTLVGNSAQGVGNSKGGAIFVQTYADLSIWNTTITGNSASGSLGTGGGLYGSQGYGYIAPRVYSSIITGNTAATSSDVNDSVQTASYHTNIFGNQAIYGGGYYSGYSTVPVTITDIFETVSGGAGVLADNGGPVRTVALRMFGAGDTYSPRPADTYDLDGDRDVSERLPVDARGVERNSGSTLGAFDFLELGGGPGADSLAGTPASDRFAGFQGNDTIDGGAGASDTAYFFGDWIDYTITQSAGTYTVSDNVLNRDGTDTLTNIEFFNFGFNPGVLVSAASALNDAPVGVDDSNGTAVTEGMVGSVTGNVLTNDTDPDSALGDTRIVNGLRTGTEAGGGAFGTVGPLAGTHGSLALNAAGDWIYTLNNADPVINALGAGAMAHDFFTYRISDAKGLHGIAQLDITITGTNDGPTAVADTRTIAEDTVGDFSTLLANDTDPDTGATKTIVSVANGTNGTVSLVSGRAIFTPTANFNGVATFSYIMTDGFVQSTATVTVTVTPVNDAPVITPDGVGPLAAISVAENATVVTTITSTDTENTPRTYSLVGGADQGKFTINATTGALAFLAAPDFETPTDANRNNVYDVIVTASDGSSHRHAGPRRHRHQRRRPHHQGPQDQWPTRSTAQSR